MIERIKSLKIKELGSVATEIRGKIIDTVSKNGGHLASNLGVVEVCVAMHYVFDSPRDKIIFDVGHQAYAHKIITGRDISTLRQYKGISGFTNPKESDHDIFYEGHSGTSISQALGLAQANKLNGKDDYTIAFIGDGSLTNGMVFEALNNCDDKDLRLIIIINDNEMSISKNVGGMHRYFSRIRTSKKYFGFKRGIEKTLRVIPLLGKPLARFALWLKNKFKRAVIKNNIFENLGLNYIGPVDGNNLAKMVAILEEAKTKRGPTVVHITTKKGFGYKDAENHPEKYHSTGKFDIKRGNDKVQSECYSTVMGEALCSLAQEDDRICGITAAMAEGTGLLQFEEKFKDRFFDVGIAEEHAVTFCSGLARQGMKPVLALYSTFVQRSYDQIFHDFSIQGLPFTLMLDRCGLVADEGITHQGIFDYSILSSIPNVTIYSPNSYNELKATMEKAINSQGIDVIRYPKGKEEKYDYAHQMTNEDDLEYSTDIDKREAVIITYGRLSALANQVATRDNTLGIIRLNKIFPLDLDKIKTLTKNAKFVYILEESYIHGGVGEKLSASLDKKSYIHGINTLVPHGSLADLYTLFGFDTDTILKNLNNLKSE
ncbi:MAG: 1-deoxy-D-xylulose-5-phosphate synthase [Clostridia bacterium]|nr:1-deoxy-D-xylulose-5-phosphate synthase [Clostridia bacterium]